jgi:two-component system cell cycle sensor histidine kinase/response regulator CckA
MVERSVLQRPASRVERALDRIDDGCVLFDERHDCVYANEAAGALLGLPRDQLVGRNLHSPFPTTIASRFQHAALAALAGAKVARARVCDESVDRWLEATMHVSSDGLWAVIADVTPRKGADLEQAAHVEYLQQLVDQIPAFLWVIDRDLIVRRIEGGRPMLEALDRDRLIGLPQKVITEMGCDAEDTELSLEMHRRALRGMPGQYRATWKGITLESRIRPLRDRDGEIIGIVGVGIDVSEQRRMEEQLRGSEERFRAVVEGSTDLIAIVGADFRVTYASSAQRRVLGYYPSELQRIDPWSLVHPDDLEYAREQFGTLDQGRRSTRLPRPIRLRTKRGEWKSFVITLTDLRRTQAVSGILLNARDITKELSLESQLRQSQKLEALGQLAGGVAHDFNNVLAAINGFAQLLEEGLARDDSRRHDVEEIRKAAERATRITRQLLAFSRHQVPASARVDLVQMVQDLSRMLRAVLPATIELRVMSESGVSTIEVLADRTQLEQVIMNLCVNARDAMPTGGSLSIDVRTGTTPETARTAVVEVRDTGVGMSPEVQTHVFEPFFTTKEPGRGTGLGLATVYGVVRQHEGSVEIASVVGEGTTVTVRLPMAPPSAEPIVPQSSGTAQDRSSGGRVLLVEDEPQVREIAARFLRRGGYEVLTAVDGCVALELLASNPIDLILTDSAMPGMRGEDLAVEVARIRPGLPVILMSGYSDPAAPASSAVAAFLQKPFTLPDLLAEVHRMIARGRKLQT